MRTKLKAPGIPHLLLSQKQTRSRDGLPRQFVVTPEPTEIRCRTCGKLYARVQTSATAKKLEVVAEGMSLRPISRKERVGVLACSCGHETLIDLELIAVQ